MKLRIPGNKSNSAVVFAQFESRHATPLGNFALFERNEILIC